MECRIKTNLKNRNCTDSGCSRKGICCDCLRYHIAKKQPPACFFPNDVEKEYDRSFERFIEVNR